MTYIISETEETFATEELAMEHMAENFMHKDDYTIEEVDEFNDLVKDMFKGRFVEGK